MLKARLFSVLLLTGAFTGVVRAEDGWSHLKLGMSTNDAVAALGQPLLRSEGRGFEVWTYDNRAEVVFYGQVIAWTAPASSLVAPRVVEDWQFAQGIPDQVILPKPIPRARPARRGENRESRPEASAYRYRSS